MNEVDKTNLTDHTKFRLNEIAKIENYFNSEINQRKTSSKKLSKYVAPLLRTLSGGVCIISSASVVGAPVGIAGAIFTLIFFFNNRNNQEITKSKLSSIETLVSQALIDMEISHEEFIMILKEKDNYEKMKENVRNVNEKQENMRLNSVNSRS